MSMLAARIGKALNGCITARMSAMPRRGERQRTTRPSASSFRSVYTMYGLISKPGPTCAGRRDRSSNEARATAARWQQPVTSRAQEKRGSNPGRKLMPRLDGAQAAHDLDAARKPPRHCDGVGHGGVDFTLDHFCSCAFLVEEPVHAPCRVGDPAVTLQGTARVEQPSRAIYKRRHLLA